MEAVLSAARSQFCEGVHISATFLQEANKLSSQGHSQVTQDSILYRLPTESASF